LKEHITSNYQNLFSAPEENNFTMLESWIDDIPQVSEVENDILTSLFTETEEKRIYFKWNIIRLHQMVSQLNSIKYFGR
jgi:hypothetical protein